MSSPASEARSSRSRWLGAAAFATLLAVVGLAAAASQPAAASDGVWILTTNTATVLGGLDGDLVSRTFGQPRTLALGGWPGAQTARGWASYGAFEADVHAGAIAPDVRAVMYDPESWAPTPIAEQRDPLRYMRAFAALAHTAGYQVILTPHPNLTSVQGAACPKGPEETIQDAYLRCRLPFEAAAIADVLDVQAQFLEADLGAYRSVTLAAVRQARAANPNIVVTAHLTTAFATAPETLLAAWNLVHDEVDGVYMGVPGGIRAELAIAFLREAEDAGTPIADPQNG
jgi:hypothetical protein